MSIAVLCKSLELNVNDLDLVPQNQEAIINNVKSTVNLISKKINNQKPTTITQSQYDFLCNNIPDFKDNISMYEIIGLKGLLDVFEKSFLENRTTPPWMVKSNISSGNTMLNSEEKDSEVYNFFPINTKEEEEDYDDYCLQEVKMWTAKEIDYIIDKEEYANTLKPRYKQMYKDFLVFFNVGDGLVTQSCYRFAMEAKNAKEQAFYNFQIADETVHMEGYAFAITAVLPLEEQKEVFEQANTLECIKAKTQFIKDLVDSNLSFGERAFAASCCEGIFFVSLFAIIFYLRDKGVMKGFVQLNKLISIDETIHRNHYGRKARRAGISRKRAIEIVERAVEIEIGHLKHILRTPVESVEEDEVIGITIPNLTNYIKSLADQIMSLSGLPSYYNVKSVVPWMADMGVQNRPNFYEVKTTEYSRSDLDTAKDWKMKTGYKSKKDVEQDKIDTVIVTPPIKQSISNIVSDPNSIDF